MLQFQCPHCEATIRVQDSAMGQRGACPKCKQTLLVPMVEAAKSQDSQPVVENQIPQSMENEAVNDLFSAISSEKESSEQESILKSTTQSQRSNKATVFTGLFFLLLGIAGASAVYFFTRPLMQDQLSAQLMPADAIKATLLKRKTINQPELFEFFWLKHSNEKIQINSKLLETSVRAQNRGLEFQLYPGSQSDLYRVDVLKNVAIHKFHSQQYTKLEGVRKNILIEATNDFLKKMVEQDQGLRQNPAMLIDIRDRLILTAMVDGLGIRLAAVVEDHPYPCVWQDKEKRYYFSLPKGTIKFIIIEAEVVGKKKVLPSSLRFVVTCPDAEKRDPDNFQSGHLLSEEKEIENKGKSEKDSEPDSESKPSPSGEKPDQKMNEPAGQSK